MNRLDVCVRLNRGSWSHAGLSWLLDDLEPSVVLQQRVSLLVAPLVPAVKVEVEVVVAEMETTASTLAQEMVVVAAARVRREWRRVYGRLVLGDGMQPPVLYSSEIVSSVTHRSVGVQCDIAELKTAGAQTDENDDAGDSSVITCSVADRSVSVQCDTAERKTAGAQTNENEVDTMALRRLSIGTPGDQAAGRALTPTTDTTVAERRVSDEAGTDPPESDASGSEKEIRMGATALIHHVDSSPEAQSHCSAVEHETGYDKRSDSDHRPSGQCSRVRTGSWVWWRRRRTSNEH